MSGRSVAQKWSGLRNSDGRNFSSVVWHYAERIQKLKGLKRENLRDHMDDFELIFTMLGERATTEIHRNESSAGMPKLKSRCQSRRRYCRWS